MNGESFWWRGSPTRLLLQDLGLRVVVDRSGCVGQFLCPILNVPSLVDDTRTAREDQSGHTHLPTRLQERPGPIHIDPVEQSPVCSTPRSLAVHSIRHVTYWHTCRCWQEAERHSGTQHQLLAALAAGPECSVYAMSGCMQRPGGPALTSFWQRFPVKNCTPSQLNEVLRSNTLTRYPLATRPSTRCRPRKPHPPITTATLACIRFTELCPDPLHAHTNIHHYLYIHHYLCKNGLVHGTSPETAVAPLSMS